MELAEALTGRVLRKQKQAPGERVCVLEFLGAEYYVANRGNARQDIFLGNSGDIVLILSKDRNWYYVQRLNENSTSP